jgi:hypothetical protein
MGSITKVIYHRLREWQALPKGVRLPGVLTGWIESKAEIRQIGKFLFNAIGDGAAAPFTRLCRRD